MKEIKDYLHLYLGCEAIITDVAEEYYGKSVFDEHWAAVGNRIILDTSMLHYLTEEWISVKPILRPLSDMSEEECKEITGYNKVQEGRELLKFEKEDKLACLDYRWKSSEFGNNDGYAYSSTAIYFDKEEWSPDNFIYLLSKHFDLFGLIEAGLAIDSLKQKHENKTNATERDVDFNEYDNFRY